MEGARRKYGVSERQACRVLNQWRGTQRYLPMHCPDEDVLTQKIIALASEYGRYGYRRITALLQASGWPVSKDCVQRIWRREGWAVNHKRVYRLYQKEGLSLRKKRPRRHASAAQRVERIKASAPNECWSMDFVSDALYDGRRLRALTVVDNYTRECLAIEVDQGIGGAQVVKVLGRITMKRRTPKTIRVDNGPEFVSKVLDQWAYRNGVTLDFSRPGKPTDNAYVESFNGSLRDECLNVNWFLSLEDARGKIEAWRRHYNESRPHTALGDVSPNEFASTGGASPTRTGSARPGIFTP